MTVKRRMIHECLWSSEHFIDLTMQQRLLWVGLITTADDQGRGRAHPGLVRAAIFPFDVIAQDDIQKDLEKLRDTGLLILYETEGRIYYQVVKWWEYQSPSWASISEHPAPRGWRDRFRYHGVGRGIVKSENTDTTVDWGSPVDNCLPIALRNQISMHLPIPQEEEEVKEEIQPVSENFKSELDAFFGEKEQEPADIPKRVDLTDPAAREAYAASLVQQRAAKKTDEPWTAYTPYRYTPRNGITAEALQRADYLINIITGLQCGSDAARKFWQNGLAQVYQEAGGNWQYIEAGIKTAWTREARYRPSNPAGFADEVRKARAATQQPATPTSGGWFIPGGSSIQPGEY